MNVDEPCGVPGVQGQLLRLSTRREVAIYLRQGALWVADFIDGQGELVDPVTWFRFNCGRPSTSRALVRMVRESALPLSGQLVSKIERLHAAAALDDSERHGGSVSASDTREVP